MSTLFDHVGAVAGPASAREPTFAFLSRAPGEPWERVRAVLESWVARLPPEARAGVVGQMRSRDDRQFQSALWELYVHEALLNAGFTVDVHPELGGSTARPDFVARRGSTRCYVECVVAFGSGRDEKTRRRVNDLYDTIERVRSPNFFLELDVLAEGIAPLPAARHRQAIEQWLGQLDPDELERRLAASGEVGEKYEIRDGGWQVELVPQPKHTDDRGAPGLRTVGSFSPALPGPIDDVEPIRKELADKSRKYGPLHHPFVVAVMVDRMFADNHDMELALYGTRAVAHTPGPPRWIRRSDGFFKRASGYVHEHVSAVLCCYRLQPASLARTPLTLWPHPSADASAALALGVAEVRLDGEQLVESPAARRPYEVVGLPRGWPGFGGRPLG